MQDWICAVVLTKIFLSESWFDDDSRRNNAGKLKLQSLGSSDSIGPELFNLKMIKWSME